jgi:hypothetical protein
MHELTKFAVPNIKFGLSLITYAEQVSHSVTSRDFDLT